MKGLHNTVVGYVHSQHDQKRPFGTIIHISTGLASILQEGIAGYATSKLAAHRYLQYVATGTVICLQKDAIC